MSEKVCARSRDAACPTATGREQAFGDAGQGKGRLYQGTWCVPGTYMAALVSKPGHRCDRCWGWERKREQRDGCRSIGLAGGSVMAFKHLSHGLFAL